MLDWLLMLQVKLPIVDTIHPQSNKFVTGVENAATGDSKLNDSFVSECLEKYIHRTMGSGWRGI